MADREKVKKGMECCTNDVLDPYACQECPYLGHKPTRDGCIKPMLLDALSLLREQVPKVMSLEEARETLHNEDFVYFIEDIDYKMLVGFRAGEDYLSLSNGDYMNLDDLDEGGSLEAEYGKTFRFWTSRPSKEQMKNAPWLE